jgi:hypothetical protein
MSAIACLVGGVAKAVVTVPVAAVAAVTLKGVIVVGGVACGILLVGGAVKMVRDGKAEDCLESGAALFTALRGTVAGS